MMKKTKFFAITILTVFYFSDNLEASNLFGSLANKVNRAVSSGVNEAKNLKNRVNSKVNAAKTGVRRNLNQSINTINNQLNNVKQSATNAANNVIKDVRSNVNIPIGSNLNASGGNQPGNIKQTAKNVVNNVKRKIGSGLNTLKNQLNTQLNNVAQTATNVVNDVGRKVGNTINNQLNTQLNNAARIATNVVNDVGKKVGNTVNTINTQLNNVTQTAINTANEINKEIGNKVNQTIDFSKQVASEAGHVVSDGFQIAKTTATEIGKAVGEQATQAKEIVSEELKKASKVAGNVVTNLQNQAKSFNIAPVLKARIDSIFRPNAKIINAKEFGLTDDSIPYFSYCLAQFAQKGMKGITLNLAGNGLTTKGLTTMFDYIKAYPDLIHILDLSNNPIGDDISSSIYNVSQQVGNSLVNNLQNLRALFLANTKVTINGANKLIKTIQSQVNNTMKHLDLSHIAENTALNQVVNNLPKEILSDGVNFKKIIPRKDIVNRKIMIRGGVVSKK